MKADAGGGQDFGADEAGAGLDAQIGGSGADLVGQTGDAARAVAAEVGFRAVRIEEPHPDIGDGGRLDQQEPVGPDAVPAVAKPCAESGFVDRKAAGTIIHEDEIVAGAMHFPEREGHGHHLATWLAGRQGRGLFLHGGARFG